MATENSDIVFIASCNVDLISYIDQMPKVGETKMGKEFKIGFGGKGANKAIACSRLGSNCAVVSKLGDDIFGKNYLENFKQNNIDISHVFITNEAATGVAPITVDENGNNSIIVILGANLLLNKEDINKCKNLIQNCKILVTNLEIPLETVINSLEMAKKFNLTTILNFAPAVLDQPIDDRLFKNTDYLILNEVECEQLSKTKIKSIDDVKTACLTLLDKYEFNTGVIVTLGERGVIYVDKELKHTLHIPSNKVKVVDTSGAGDAFVGAFAHYLSKCGKESIQKAIHLANEYASLTVQKLGTQSSYPRIQTLDDKF